MRRRTALAGVVGAATGLTGCFGGIVGNESGDEATPVPDGEQRRVRFDDTGSVPEGVPLSIDASLPERRITGTRTARVWVELTTEGSSRAVTVGSGGCALFNRAARASDPAGLWLARGDRDVDRDGNAWVADDLPSDPEGFGGYGCTPTALEAGEALTNGYAVWDDGRVDGYLEPGTYRWEAAIGVWAPPEAAGSPDRTFDWHLSLDLLRSG